MAAMTSCSAPSSCLGIVEHRWQLRGTMSTAHGLKPARFSPPAGDRDARRSSAPNPRRRAGTVRCLWGIDTSSLVLGVGVGLPCHFMDCGDVIYRSTLPQSNPFQPTPQGIALAALIVAYLWATPGVIPGFWDMFLLSPLEERLRPKLRKDNLTLGKKLGEGAYGTVYRATLKRPQSNKEEDVVVKRANEFGAVEIWMNERARRACRNSCASFIDGFLEKPAGSRRDEFWLVWRYEGNATLANVLADKDFPYNVEEAVLGRSAAAQGLPRGAKREARIVRALMRQLLLALQRLHATGIVHRDIKPQNIIFSPDTGQLKIIDLGAAADLRVGINYVPKEFLLDPRYAAPEQYIMSKQTPAAPPPPVAAALSPVLWQMNLPDRFDVYSSGLIFLQMAFPNLRSDSSLISFNRQLKRCNYNLAAWREAAEKRGGVEIQRGFDLLDADGGQGWELLQSMVRFKGRERVSAGGALAHPFFYPGALSPLQKVRLSALRLAYRDNAKLTQAFLAFLSPTASSGALSEMQLQEIRERQAKEVKKGSLQRNALASALRLKRKVARTMTNTMEEFQAPPKKPGFSWWNRWES